MNQGLRVMLCLALAVALGMLATQQALAQSDAGSAAKSEAAAKCPVTGEDISKDAAIDYKGGKLYFCCKGCIPKYQADTAKYEAKANQQLVAKGQAKQVACPLSGRKVDANIKMKVGGIDVSFCCDHCPAKLKGVSAEEQTQVVFVKGFDKAFKVKKDKQK